MLFRFEVSEKVAEDFKKLVATSAFLEDTPRSLVSKLISREAERLDSGIKKTELAQTRNKKEEETEIDTRLARLKKYASEKTNRKYCLPLADCIPDQVYEEAMRNMGLLRSDLEKDPIFVSKQLYYECDRLGIDWNS